MLSCLCIIIIYVSEKIMVVVVVLMIINITNTVIAFTTRTPFVLGCKGRELEAFWEIHWLSLSILQIYSMFLIVMSWELCESLSYGQHSYLMFESSHFWWESNPRSHKIGLQISGLLTNHSTAETLLSHWQIDLHMARYLRFHSA